MKNILHINHILYLFFLATGLSPVAAQQIDLVSDPKYKEAAAINFEIPERKQTLILLYGPLDRATGWFQVFLLNEQLELVKKGERAKVDLDVNTAENQVKYMGRHNDGANAYVWWQFSNTFGGYIRGIKIDFETLRISTTAQLESNLQREWWGGIAFKGNFYLLGKEKKRKGDDLLNMYAFDPVAGKFQERSIPVPEKSVFDDKQFSAAVQSPGRYVSRKNQFFSNDGALYCLSETDKDELRVTSLDPEALKIFDWKITNPPKYEHAKGRSVLADGKIFRMIYTPERFQISIHALSDGSLLFSDSISSKQRYFKLFNAPVTYVGPKEGLTIWRQKNDTVEVKSILQFLEEMDRADETYLYLSIAENGYNLRLLTNNTLTYGGASFPNQAPTASTYLYTHMYALLALHKDLSRMTPRTTTDVFNFNTSTKQSIGPWVLAEITDTYLDYPFYTLFGKRFSGDWNGKTHTYTLKKTDF